MHAIVFQTPILAHELQKNEERHGDPIGDYIRYPPKKTYPLSFSEVVGGFIY